MYLLSSIELNNRYKIEGVLGHGGFGITYSALDKVLNVKVAIKEYLPRQLATRAEGQTKVSVFTGESRKHYEYGLKKFLEEAQSVAQFSHHPNIVSARDYFEANGTAYMVMEYVEGVTLKEYLEKKGGRISFEEARAIMMPVMDALREVHSVGLLHRDISPDNIYITTTGQVKVIDFGAARYYAGEHSKSLSVILKPGYAPEEQYRSSGKQGTWTDVYAVGATFYKALTGKTPPEALDRREEDTLEPPSKLGVAIPPGAEQALLKALAVSATQRFQSIRELQEAIHNRMALPETPQQTITEPLRGQASGLSGRTSTNKSNWKNFYTFTGIAIGIVLLGSLLWMFFPLPPTNKPKAGSKIKIGEQTTTLDKTSPEVAHVPPSATTKPKAEPEPKNGVKTTAVPPSPEIANVPPSSTPTMASDTENRAKNFLEQGPVGGQAVSNNLVFVRNGNVWIATSDGTNARQLTFTGHASRPVLSPDGSLVAFLGPGQNKHETKIFLIPSQGGNIRALDLPNLYHLYDRDLNFSPDGKHLLFRSSSRQHNIQNVRFDITVSILMVNWQNLSLRKILSKGGVCDEQDIMRRPAFSPDGNLIVYEEEYEIGGFASGFVIIDLTGKEISRYPFNLRPPHLKEEPSYIGEGPSFSPDGQEILCDSYSSKKTANGVGNFIIYLVNWRTGAKRKLALGSSPTFVDGGKAIVFERNRNRLYNSPHDLYRLDLAPGAQPRLILRNARLYVG